MNDKFIDAWFDSMGNLVRKRTAIKLSDGDFLDQITERTSNMSQQQPSIGRVVHFVNGDQHVPALITDPNYNDQGECALTVFPVNEQPFTIIASFDPDGAPATWHWPEFVPPKA